MRCRTPVLTVLLLAGCHATPASRARTPGDRLEAAAQAAGLVADPARASPVGLYARENDRLCVVPGAGDGFRVGALVRFDDGGQGCLARGTATLSGDRLRIAFGACRLEARFEGDRVALPAVLPPACDAACTGRASLSALVVDRLSNGVTEAAAQTDRRGNPLCID